MQPIHLKSFFDDSIFCFDENKNIDSLINFSIILIIKIEAEKQKNEAKAFSEKLIKGFNLGNESKVIICKTLPDNLSEALNAGVKILLLGFSVNLNNTFCTYDFSTLQSLEINKKKQVWAAMKQFVVT